MLFSSLIFLYAFLPLVLILGWSAGQKLQNYVLLFFSLVFYAWGGVSYTAIIICSILFNYFFGLLVQKYSGQKKNRMVLVTCIACNLLLLFIIKYANFFVTNINSLFATLNIEPLKNPNIKLIPGISFFTFHSISYIVDIYRKDSIAQRNVFSMGLYMAFFPQLIAGPIIRYHEIADQFQNRRYSADNITYGIKRFLTGLVKKVIFSNTFAVPADEIFSRNIHDINTPVAWFGIICYSLHIYCDFSGYSDMAIGLGKMFGFTFPENFNFPYIAKSIQEFWHRWHMTLSRWFRDYVYIPLGGNRKGPARTYFNLILVFFLTGLWHGASWTMVTWGLFHGLFLLLERLFLKNLLQKLHLLNHLYTLLVVMVAWVFFKSPDFSFASNYIGKMFGAGSVITSQETSFLNYMNPEFNVIFIVALIFASSIPQWIKNKIVLTQTGKSLVMILNPIVYSNLLILLLACSFYLNKQGYNPFIYFQF